MMPCRGTALILISADVLDANRRAAVFGEHHSADFLGRAEQADAPDEELLLALLDVTAAGIGVGAFEAR